MSQLLPTPTTIDRGDSAPALLTDDRRRSGSALFLSALLHGLVMLLLSWIVLHSTAESDPVITLVLNDDLSDQTAEEFQMAPDIAVAEIVLPDQNIVLPDTVPLPEDSSISISADLPEVASSVFASAGTSGTGHGAAANIQGRVNTAGGRQGEVQFALAWENFHDLDLHVIAPSGEHIAYYHRQSECDGELDVDMNVHDGDSQSPVENVRWLGRDAPKQRTSNLVNGKARYRNSASAKPAPVGRYTVLVNLFRYHKRRSQTLFPTEYRLLVKLGEHSEIVTGSVQQGHQSVSVHRFIYVPDVGTELRQRLRREQLEALQISEEAQAQSVFKTALQLRPQVRQDSRLKTIIDRFPHTDAAIEALKMTSGSSNKR